MESSKGETTRAACHSNLSAFTDKVMPTSSTNLFDASFFDKLTSLSVLIRDYHQTHPEFSAPNWQALCDDPAGARSILHEIIGLASKDDHNASPPPLCLPSPVTSLDSDESAPNESIPDDSIALSCKRRRLRSASPPHPSLGLPPPTNEQPLSFRTRRLPRKAQSPQVEHDAKHIEEEESHEDVEEEEEVEDILDKVTIHQEEYYVTLHTNHQASLHKPSELRCPSLVKQFESSLKSRRLCQGPSDQEVVATIQGVEFGGDGLPKALANGDHKLLIDRILSNNFHMNDEQEHMVIQCIKRGSTWDALNRYFFGGLLHHWRAEAGKRKCNIFQFWKEKAQSELANLYCYSQMYKFVRFHEMVNELSIHGRLRFLCCGYSFERLFNIGSRFDLFNQIKTVDKKEWKGIAVISMSSKHLDGYDSDCMGDEEDRNYLSSLSELRREMEIDRRFLERQRLIDQQKAMVRANSTKIHL